MMKEAILDDSPHRDIRLNDVFNKITDIWQHQNSVTTGSKPTMTCDVIESVRSDLNEPISHDEESPGGHPLEIATLPKTLPGDIDLKRSKEGCWFPYPRREH
uniref:Uncharacterized protein n=1 Tax=Cacopsylla melanoneura TaxID=428564 RepID=A0A8D9ETX1_9HEMI